MHVLLVGRNAQIGGGSTFRLNIGRALRERGHRVGVAAMGGPMVARYRDAGLEFHWAPPFPICAPLLSRAVRRQAASILHASNTTAGDLALEASRSARVPLVVSLHNTIANHESTHACLKEARRIIVFDAGAAASAGQFTQEFNTGKILRLPRPVPHRPADQGELSPLRAVYVGRLSSRKGRVALNVIEGFGRFAREAPGASLTILGGGSMRREVERAAADTARSTGCAIDVRGQVVDPNPLVAGAGIIIGAGYAALEAVMQGRAVIGAGFNGYGLVTETNVLDAIECNFGDTVQRWEMTPDNFHEAFHTLRGAWSTPATRSGLWGLDRVAAPLHAADAVAARLEAVYEEAIAGA